MQQFPVAQTDVGAVFVQLTADEKQGVYYDPLPAAVFAPDDKAAAVQAAIATLPNGQKLILKAHAANSRATLASGTVRISGNLYWSDPVSRNTVTSAHAYAQANPGHITDWKLADGTFVQLNEPELGHVEQQMATFVQSCFTCESNMVAGIDGGTITTDQQIDDAFAAISNVLP